MKSRKAEKPKSRKQKAAATSPVAETAGAAAADAAVPAFLTAEEIADRTRLLWYVELLKETRGLSGMAKLEQCDEAVQAAVLRMLGHQDMKEVRAGVRAYTNIRRADAMVQQRAIGFQEAAIRDRIMAKLVAAEQGIDSNDGTSLKPDDLREAVARVTGGDRPKEEGS